MGIRFQCPHCTGRLHVKAFLAGKRGVCPKCGGKIDIPFEDELPPRDAAATERGQRAEVADDPQMDFDLETESELPQPISSHPRPATKTARPAGTSGTRNQNATSATVSKPAKSIKPNGAAAPATTAQPARGPAPRAAAEAIVPVPAAPATPSQPASVDALAEAPHAVWYVRPPSGGQYGPARGDIMQRWMAEGRITGDSLVWREGWPEWRVAAEVLPALQRTAPTAAVAPVATEAALPAAITSATSTAAASMMRYQKKRREKRGLWTASIVLLSVVAVGLIVTLIIVLNR